MSIAPRHAACAFLLSATASPAAGAVLDVPLTPFVVRLYEAQALPPSESESALREAQAIFAEAGLALESMPCLPHPFSDARCLVPLRGAELAVRLVTGPERSSTARSLSLGYSLVDGGTRGGALATIYLDRVRWLASTWAADAAELLGRAIAHEIGHLLLGTSDHGSAGVMRASWSGTPGRSSRPQEWLFSLHEARQMQAAVRTRSTASERGPVWIASH